MRVYFQNVFREDSLSVRGLLHRQGRLDPKANEANLLAPSTPYLSLIPSSLSSLHSPSPLLVRFLPGPCNPSHFSLPFHPLTLEMGPIRGACGSDV